MLCEREYVALVELRDELLLPHFGSESPHETQHAVTDLGSSAHATPIHRHSCVLSPETLRIETLCASLPHRKDVEDARSLTRRIESGPGLARDTRRRARRLGDRRGRLRRGCR